MVYIPPGSFQMGDSFHEGDPAELPVHTVFISGFRMDKFQVSGDLWSNILTWAQSHGYDIDPSSAAGGAFPTTPRWYDAVKWCNARSEREGLTPIYYTDAGQTSVYRSGWVDLTETMVNWSAKGYRLPTEAEWEKAARGGLVGKRYPWGDTIYGGNANYLGSGDPYESLSFPTTPAGYYNGSQTPAGPDMANGYGLYDMAGNVLEHCWDWLDSNYYNTSQATNNNPHGPSSSPYGCRILRGGAWNDTTNQLRCACRRGTTPVNGSQTLGFRCVTVADPPALTRHPSNTLAQVGSTAAFSATASGTDTLKYQWRFNGTNLIASPNVSGATNSTMIISNVQLTDFGFYSIVITNDYGGATSSAALLNILRFADLAQQLPDSDSDGIPDVWETAFGLDPDNPSDAGALCVTTNGMTDRLTYLQKFRYGLNPQTLDTDGDGLSDYDELFVYGSNPLSSQTSGDGIPDAWKVQYGLSPLLSNADMEISSSGVTYRQVYQYNLTHTNQLDPRDPLVAPGTSIYEVINNGQHISRFYYDNNDRLIGTEYSQGLSLAYTYDGNDNLLRQTALSRATETNNLPALWQFLNGLTNNISPYSDSDGDGWSDYEEWRGGSNPLDPGSVPTSAPQSAPMTTILPDPNLGNGLATNLVRVWNAVGNSSWLEMQFQPSGTTNWTNISIVSIDGSAYGAASALPSGSTHQVVWNAGQQLGTGISNNLFLQARAHDVTLTGSWSLSVSYRVEISVGNPMAADDATNTLENAAVDINVLANDTVQAPAPKLISSVGQPIHGTTSTNVNGVIRYSPATNFSGSDSFVYTLTDGAGGISIATVRVTVIHVNQPPVASPFTFDTAEDTPLIIQWNPATDAEGDLVTLQVAGPTSVQGGTVVKNGDTLTYTPPLNFNGTDTFTYTVVDNGTTAGTNDFKTATGTVTVNVTPVNDPPVISAPGLQAVARNTLLMITNLSVADVDAGSGQMLLSLSATNGSMKLNSTNGLTFTAGANQSASMTITATLAAINSALTNLAYLPLTNFYGSDNITVFVNDQGNTGAGGPLTDTKSIPITVTFVKYLPVVALTQPTNGAVFIAPATIPLTATAYDIDGPIVKVEFFQGTNLLCGALTNPPFQFVWSNVPAGVYSLFAKATDSFGATNVSAVATITNRQPGFVQLDTPQNPNGFFSLLIQGEAGQVYEVQSSSNLNDWITVGTVTNSTGSVPYTEQVPTNATQRYYRAKVAQ